MKLRTVLAQTIAMLPLKFLRRAAYRLLLGYEISKKADIGFGTVIAVQSALLGRCRISKFTRFIGPMRLTIGDGTTVGARNRFDCGEWAKSTIPEGAPYARSITIGENAVVTGQHHFDVIGSLHIGDRSWIAGVGSQFWTHGVGASRRDVFIGSDCYIGSAVRFTPGSAIPDGSIVGVGSVVSKVFSEPNSFIAGVPAKWVKTANAWVAQRAVQNEPS